MNRLGYNSKIIIWTSCIAYVVLVTITIAYAYKYYGVVGVLFVLLIAEFLLQVYKMVYQHKAVRVKYDTSHVINITNCWAIYQILNHSLLTGGVFTYLIMLAEIEALNIPKRVWLVVVIILACAWSIITIQPFVRKEKYEGKLRRPTKLISSFVPRFVILYTFFVYYFIACFDSAEKDFIQMLCLVYLGVDRLFAMYNTIREYEQQEYYSLFRDTVRWLRRRRGMETAIGTSEQVINCS